MFDGGGGGLGACKGGLKPTMLGAVGGGDVKGFVILGPVQTSVYFLLSSSIFGNVKGFTCYLSFPVFEKKIQFWGIKMALNY